jgi:hypothetical protein
VNGPDGALVGPVVNGELVGPEDGPQDGAARVLVDSPESTAAGSFLERLQACNVPKSSTHAVTWCFVDSP